MITDVHTHIYDEKTYKTYFDKTGNAVSRLVVMGWYKYKIEDAMEFASQKDNVFITGSVDIDDDIKTQLEKLDKFFQEKKLFGIKLYPGYQYFYPSDEKIYSIAELCQQYDKPLIFHSGDVYNPEKDAMLKYAHPIHIDELATKFPKCKIIISHFGFPYHLETANIVSKNKNVFTEVSGTIDKCDSDEEAKNMLNQYTGDLQRVFSYYPDVKAKVMFGTDYGGEDTPLNEVKPYIKLVENVFAKKEQENVFYKLAEEIFGFKSGT